MKMWLPSSLNSTGTPLFAILISDCRSSARPSAWRTFWSATAPPLPNDRCTSSHGLAALITASLASLSCPYAVAVPAVARSISLLRNAWVVAAWDITR